MPKEQKNIIGKMNLDVAPSMMPTEDYGEAFNIVRDAQGQGQDRIVSTMLGNTLVSYSLPTGTNKSIGNKPDNVRNRIYNFIWNSNGNHLIIYLDFSTQTFTKLIENKTDSNGVDILNFNPSYRINHIDIIYRDAGDLLYWTDNLNPPSKINVSTFAGGSLLPYQRSFLNAAKEPPLYQPYCVYQDDSTVTVNNLRKKLFRFKHRFVYDDLEKSSCSAISEVPLPQYYSFPSIDSDPTKNACIFLVLQTGAANVKKIEVLAQQSLGNVWGNFFLITVLDKSAGSGIENNTTISYQFYNNEAYNYIPVDESIELFDYVPQVAATQALANGNTLVYAGITENYDLLIPTTDIDDLPTSSTLYLYPTELLNAQNAPTFGGTVVRAFVGGNPTAGDVFNIVVTANSITYTITYTVAYGDTLADIVTGLTTNLVSQGFTLTASVPPTGFQFFRNGFDCNVERYYITEALRFKTLTIPTQFLFGASPNNTLSLTDFTDRSYFPEGQTFKVTNSTLNTGIFTVQSTEIALIGGHYYLVIHVAENTTAEFVTPTDITFINNFNQTNLPEPAYDWNSRGGYGIVYFDEEERTNGVVIPTFTKFQTSNYQESNSPYIGEIFIPKLLFSIGSRPPLWAETFSIVRTKDLSKSNLLQWITIQTFKDNIPNANGYQYAYVSIANLNQFIIDNPASNFLAYSFTPNDRIRFIKRYNDDGTTANIYASKDYEILASLTDPIINGAVQKGQIIKIVLPPTDSTFDFGGDLFQNYFIELYTPALSVSNNLNVYYEFGEKYRIGNAGTTNAFHYGMTQNQLPDLSQTADFEFTKGWYYSRNRNINLLGETNWIVNQIDSTGYDPFPPLQISSNDITPNTYQVNSTPGFLRDGYIPSDSFPNATAWAIFKNDINATLVLNIRGTVSFKMTADKQFVAFGVEFYNGGIFGFGGNRTNIQITQVNNVSTGVTGSITINANITFPSGYNRAYFYLTAGNSGGFQGSVLSGNLRVSPIKSLITQSIIDPNFSDNFQSNVNQDGRAYIHDPNAKRTYFPTLIRHGQAYQDGTNINGLNRFYGVDLDEYPRDNGSVTKLFVEGKYLYVFQQFDIGVVPVLIQIITDTANNPLQTDSTKLLNTIQYPYKGKYGMTFPESFAYYKDAKYGVDGTKNVVWRLSQDGLIPISIEKECNAFFQALLPAYNSTLNNGVPPPSGIYLGNPTVYGGFDFFTNKYIVSLEEINRYDIQYLSTENGIDIITESSNYLITENQYLFHQYPATLVFWETRDESEGFECKTNYYPEGIGSIGTLLYTLKNGQIWVHNNQTNYANFYGVQYYPSITIIFNEKVGLKKTFLSIAYQANGFWVSPTNGDITTSQTNQQTGLAQISQLIQSDYELQENLYYAALLRDANSMADAREALVNGDVLKGTWVNVKLIGMGGEFAFLYLPYMNYSFSPKNI
jgi:hypothetical protein